jgi:L,D-peptidoglycan transpeptidase YkuD (ErfK/YbiS/YcfS/YnhG family)
MRARFALVVLAYALLTSSHALAQTCPALIETASRLIVVTVPTLDSSTGTLRRFERTRSDAGWSRVGSAEPVNVGNRGVAWGRAFRHLAGDNEPIKSEGDKRTPAGIYAVGRPFGFARSSLANYLRLKSDNVCVEDPSSPAYNTITSEQIMRRSAGGENMGAMPRYRRGLIVDYPTDAANRAGSCIFIHVWKSPRSGTSGCLTLPENRVSALQKFADEHATVLALVPQSALGKLSGCLPAAFTESR